MDARIRRLAAGLGSLMVAIAFNLVAVTGVSACAGGWGPGTCPTQEDLDELCERNCGPSTCGACLEDGGYYVYTCSEDNCPD